MRSGEVLGCIAARRCFKRRHKLPKHSDTFFNEHPISCHGRIFVSVKKIAANLIHDAAYCRQPPRRRLVGISVKGSASLAGRAKLWICAIQAHVSWRQLQYAIGRRTTSPQDTKCRALGEGTTYAAHKPSPLSPIRLSAIHCVERHPELREL